MTNLKWLTPELIYEHYLTTAKVKGGTSAFDAISRCYEQINIETSLFETTGAKTEDRPDYEQNIKPLYSYINAIKADVRKLIVSDAEVGKWIAFGRRHPDAEEEVIPARYWPFLTLDIENRAATGDDKSFRAVRGLITMQIPEGHPILNKIREAQKITKTSAEPASDPTPHPAPAVPGTGAPGRPSSMHLIKPEFQRRVENGTIEESLNKESKALVAWLTTTHPTMPPLTPKTVANNLREEYRTATQSS